MSETALTVPEPEVEELEVHLVARDTEEMHLAKDKLQDWLRAKIKAVKADANDLMQAHDIAVERKWGSSTLQRHAEKASKRLEFYKKVLTVVEAGYTIVPNFPVDLFAIRVNKNKPKHKHYAENSHYGNQPTVPSFQPKALVGGEGKYVSDLPRGQASERTITNDKGEKIIHAMFDVSSYGDVEFPIACARPIVMEATAEAMALRVFDAIGICPQRNVRKDPLIIGQVRMKRGGWLGDHIVSFLIAWHLDVRTL